MNRAPAFQHLPLVPSSASKRPPPCVKIRVGSADNSLEREAERNAEAVVAGWPVRWNRASSAASAGEERYIETRQLVREGGVLLTPAQRAYFEPQLGHDFGDVRIHTDGEAMRSAARMDANAYTLGQHIAFAAGQFAPETVRGQRLIAHELSHVV